MVAAWGALKDALQRAGFKCADSRKARWTGLFKRNRKGREKREKAGLAEVGPGGERPKRAKRTANRVRGMLRIGWEQRP